MSVRLVCYLFATLIAAGVALSIGMLAGGAAQSTAVAGIPDAGAITRWGLPAAKVLANLLAVATVGCLVAAVALFPSNRGLLGEQARRYVQGASWAALGWVAAATLTLLFTLSDLLAAPVPLLAPEEIIGFISTLPQGQALSLVVILVTGVALCAGGVNSVNSTAGLLVVALVALLPPVLTGHSASSPNHSMAIIGLGLHVVTLTLWIGGLAATLAHALMGSSQPAIAARRFSRLALWCFAGVAVSGVASAAARLTDFGQVVSSPYGLMLLAKTAALVLLGLIGWLHRRRTLADLDAGRPRAFQRVAVGELLVMAAVVGLAVALSRTAPPTTVLPSDPARDLLGYALPPEITLGRLATMWRPDLFFALAVVTAGVLYLLGVLRLRRRGDRWPVGRSVAWILGLAIIVVFTQSGIAVYAPVLFSMHMMQHMGLAMLAPIFVVLGAPVTLALRAIKPAVRGDRGPREWIVTLLHSRFSTVVTHPAVAVALFVSGSYALYFTSLFETAMRQPVGHILMNVHFLLSGLLFFWTVIGVDPGPRRLPYIGRLMALMMTMPFHAFFGIAMMSMGTVIASSWYEGLGRTWGVSALTDQQTAGGMAWAFGEIPTMIVVITIAVQWGISDHREARREDRRSDLRADADLAAYNDYLKRLGQRGGER
ncbi:ABC transporter permease [Microtetraspora sp. NBRC 13810]|uniref:cytochrome c oxidase assembly protein n=1 Tax=Microtetraspora sp. NBRC 13810 TaxID=3030990 RepID=UPI0024A2D953|nr:cytochrome c oxidase assembly protein [Microtetraspora sp. NBRC 13810]GLW11590.1 ABC transporter permease [Microtetraspora sp. NBRC 13810]